METQCISYEAETIFFYVLCISILCFKEFTYNYSRKTFTIPRIKLVCPFYADKFSCGKATELSGSQGVGLAVRYPLFSFIQYK